MLRQQRPARVHRRESARCNQRGVWRVAAVTSFRPGAPHEQIQRTTFAAPRCGIRLLQAHPFAEDTRLLQRRLRCPHLKWTAATGCALHNHRPNSATFPFAACNEAPSPHALPIKTDSVKRLWRLHKLSWVLVRALVTFAVHTAMAAKTRCVARQVSHACRQHSSATRSISGRCRATIGRNRPKSS